MVGMKVHGGNSIYQTMAGNLVVNNTLQEGNRHDDIAGWLAAVGEGSPESSLIVVAADGRVIYLNNGFGSFDDAESSDLETVSSVCRWLTVVYGRGADTIRMEIMAVLVGRGGSRRFALKNLDGENIEFRVCPARESGGVAGAVLLARKHGTKISGRRELARDKQ